MSAIGSRTVCGECGAPIDEILDTPVARKRCTSCGGTTRTLGAHITESAIARDGTRFKANRPGEKKPYVEAKRGPSHSHRLNKLVEHERVIDRDNDTYTERVTDYESGEIHHQCDEPLSKHIDHGSAKKKCRT